jgi:5-methylcytosine-specific restriction endonuclease McrA
MGKKKQLKERTRASGTMTEAEFWSFIRSALRQKSTRWKPIYTCKNKARRKNQSDNLRLKWEYQCAECKEWFPEKQIEVDHIVPAGTLTCAADLAPFVEKLFCEEEGLRVLCESCHAKVTAIQRGNRKK